MSFTTAYLSEVSTIAQRFDTDQIHRCATLLAEAKRVFVLGNGGSAANASHFVNDLRKIAGIEAYAPTDNVAELTARTNDDGWHTAFVGWLKTSHLDLFDLVFVLSVGGGSVRTSPNIISALIYAREAGAQIAGIVGRSEGYTKQVADACIVVPNVNEEHVTPHAESFQSILCHLLVWHPALQS